MTFKNPWLLILIPIALASTIFFLRNARQAVFRFSSTSLLKGLGRTWKTRFSQTPLILRLAAIILFIIALAGPRSILEKTIHETEGVEIVLAIDASGSMAAEDFTIKGKRVNRLAVVKNVVEEFIQQRSSDRIGLIAFAGLAYVVSPLTTDYDWLSANLERIELGLIKDGTAIGSGIISSISRLKKSEAKSKIVIILTDGINNAGKIDPLKAAQAAKAFGIKIYTIGAGSADYVPFPVQDLFGRIIYRKVLIEQDEETLKEIARTTGGIYFRATDEKSLRNIYNEIDALEKTTIENTGYKEHKEIFQSFLLMALLLIAWDIVLSNTLFMKTP